MSRRIIAGLTLTLVVAAFWTLGLADEPTASRAEPAPDPKRFAREIDAFVQWDRKNAWPADGVLFVGSSSIRMWPSRESFPELPVINRGFGGAQIPDVIHYYDQVVRPYAPRVIVFYCGDNDIADGRTPRQVATDFATLRERIRRDFPKAQVIYLPAKPSIARWKLWPQMHEANSLVKTMAEGDPLLTFAPTDVALLDDKGQPRRDLFIADGLHLNGEGYLEWTQVVKPLIDAAMRAPAATGH